MAATVALVHGAWHGAWCWDKVQTALAERGIPKVAIDLPGHGDSLNPLGGLYDDAAALQAMLDTIDGDVVVCGHSYGGAVITEGALRPHTMHLVYLTAFQLEQGESCMSVAAGEIGPDEGPSELGAAMQRHDDGTFTLDPEIAARVLYNDCSDDDIAWALVRLGPQHVDSLAQPATRAAWHDIRSTYVVCTEDLAVTPALQRAMATRADDVVDWPTSHSPFLSRPDLVADLLAGLAARD
jgi:pimeloyl-ACP methyl ester carboxylesterase